MTTATNTSSSDRPEKPGGVEKCHLLVCTTAIPRMLVGRCLGSFLDCLVDRQNFSLHWKVHLDRYADLDGHFEETRQQIEQLGPRFDSWEMAAASVNRGFGGAANTLFRVAASSHCDALWIEDDWLWTVPFQLAAVRHCLADSGADQFTFVPRKAEIGNMHPTYWSNRQLRYVSDYFPADLDTVCEGSIVRICKTGGFKLCSVPGFSPCRHIGNEKLIELGHTHNHVGQRLDGRYHRPRWDAEKRNG